MERSSRLKPPAKLPSASVPYSSVAGTAPRTWKNSTSLARNRTGGATSRFGSKPYPKKLYVIARSPRPCSSSSRQSPPIEVLVGEWVGRGELDEGPADDEDAGLTVGLALG